MKYKGADVCVCVVDVSKKAITKEYAHLIHDY